MEIITFDSISKRKNLTVDTMWRNPQQYKRLKKIKRREVIRTYLIEIKSAFVRALLGA